jgi:hypothetical protein
VDTLLDIKLSAEDGDCALTDDEIVSLYSEFLNADTDTTSTGLQWIMTESSKIRRYRKSYTRSLHHLLSLRTAQPRRCFRHPRRCGCARGRELGFIKILRRLLRQRLRPRTAGQAFPFLYTDPLEDRAVLRTSLSVRPQP